MKSIILFGTWGEDNTGDDILLLSQIEGIRARCLDCGIAIFSGVPVHTKKLLDRELISYDHIEIVYTGRLGIREPGQSFPHSLGWFARNLREISRGRLLVIGPGNQLQDVTMRFRVVFFLSRAVAAWILRTPYAFVGIGYYQLTSRWNDRVALERIRDRFQGTDVPVETVEFRSLDELRRSISLCDAFIGVRYHSVLLSVQGEVPVMGISYAHKTQRFMQENGLGDYVIRVEDVTSERLREIWERLWRNRDEVREMLPGINEHETALARKHFDLIFRIPGKENAGRSLACE